MRRPRRLEKCRALVAIGALAWSGCSLVTSLSGLSDGEDVTAGDGSPGEAGADEAASDAAAGTDAADGALNADAGPFCARVDAMFCEDFDEPSAAARWTLSSVQRAAHGIDQGAFTSSPSSLFATTDTMTAGQSAESYRTITLPQAATSLSYAFNLRLDTRGQRGFIVGGAGLTAAGVRYAASIVLGGGSSDYLEESKLGTPNAFDDHALSASVPLGKWTRVAVSVTRKPAGTYRVVVSLDGVTVLDQDLTLWSGFASGTPAMAVGSLYASGPSSPWAIRIDDVTFDVQ